MLEIDNLILFRNNIYRISYHNLVSDRLYSTFNGVIELLRYCININILITLILVDSMILEYLCKKIILKIMIFN